jgi:hypothetical protein
VAGLSRLRSVSLDAIDHYTRRLLSITGLSPANVWRDADDYHFHSSTLINPGALITSAGTGGDETHAFSEPGGVWRISSNGNGTRMHQWGSTVTNTKTKKWGCAVRMKKNGAVDAAMNCSFGVRDVAGGNTVAVGVIGALDTAQFILQYDGAFAGSHVDLGAVDDNYHVFLFGSNGSQYFYSFDGAALAYVTPVAGVTTAPGLFRRAEHNAADKQLYLDWHVALGERA